MQLTGGLSIGTGGREPAASRRSARGWVAALMAASLLSGCATRQDYEARGNFIVVARFDSRYPPGSGEPRMVTDNAGGLPSMAAGAAGMPTSPSSGAALNVGVAAVVNILAGEAIKGTIPNAFKVVYEKDCQYEQVTVDLLKNPESDKLYPGYIGKITRSDAGDTQMLPIRDARGEQVYLAKADSCYNAWVKEWRLHQLVMQTRPLNWGVHQYLISRKSVDEMPYPDLPWVK